MAEHGRRFTLSGICCLGDSQTECLSVAAGLRWPALLATQLSTTVYNAGKASGKTIWALGGEDSDETPPNTQVSQWEYFSQRAKYFLIKFGLNDISTTYFPGDSAAQRKQRFEDDTRRVCRQVIAFGGVPILVKNLKLDIPTTYTADSDRNTKTEDYDAVKDTIAADMGIGVIDLYSMFNTQIGVDPDFHASASDLHYNTLGNQLVADEIESYFDTNGLTP